MEPNSVWLLVVLFGAAIGALWLLARSRRLVARLAGGALALALATAGGMGLVNDYYGYYQSWNQLSADVSGDYSAFTTTAIGDRVAAPDVAGKVVSTDFPGATSHIDRPGFVYLPPQYFQARYANTRFPVVELLHGSPSFAASWLVHVHADEVANSLISKRLMGPMILVMPSTYSGKTYEECLNSSRGQDATYLTTDVRVDVTTKFRAATDPAQWALVGVSSGGYCAANLSLQHPGDFGAVGILSGYFRPQDGPAATVLGHNAAAEAANDPLLEARRLSTANTPLPSYWLAAGTGDAADIAGARAFIAALHGVEQTTLYVEPGGEHNFYTFDPAFDRVLPWAWTQIAAPDLRVAFPIAGPVTEHSVTIPVTSGPQPTPPRKVTPAAPRRRVRASSEAAPHSA